MKNSSIKHKLDTKLIHAGEPRPGVLGAVSLPVFQSATYEYSGESTDYHDLRYIRLNNTPNHVALHQKLAALENAEDALVFASGMAAISTALLTVLRAGDHVILQNCLYGGTHDFATKDLPDYGIGHGFIDAERPETWEKALKPNTRALYVETISNPMMKVADLKALAAFAKKHGLVSMIDNTFASPVNFRPIEWGFDISLHSATKYLNGHTDIVAGAAIGSKAIIAKIKHKLDHLGGSLDPHACFLLHRGLKTLGVRVRRQNESAGKLAKFLARHRAVKSVNYPGLGQKNAAKFLDGFGGMLSFELKGGLAAARKFMRRVTLPVVAPSLGGVESLVTRPATTSHAGMTANERQALGITDSLVRVSVGLEDAGDLIADFDQALKR